MANLVVFRFFDDTGTSGGVSRLLAPLIEFSSSNQISFLSLFFPSSEKLVRGTLVTTYA